MPKPAEIRCVNDSGGFSILPSDPSYHTVLAFLRQLIELADQTYSSDTFTISCDSEPQSLLIVSGNLDDAQTGRPIT